MRAFAPDHMFLLRERLKCYNIYLKGRSNRDACFKHMRIEGELGMQRKTIRFRTTSLTVLLMLLLQMILSSHALGANVWTLDELGLSLELPENYVVFTRNIKENDPNLAEYGLAKKAMDNIMRSGNIYLNAWDEDVSHEIVVTMIESSFPDFSGLSDTALLALVSMTVEPYEAAGATVNGYEIYQHDQTKFIKLYLDQQNEGTLVHTVQYYTTVSKKAINITMHYYAGEVDAYNERVLQDIVDSAVFVGATETPTPVESTASFKYSDPKTGAAFTVPRNWKQEELSKEREIIKAKFISNEDSGLMILYGSVDLWEAMSESERMGFSRSDINNSALSKEDVSQMLDVKPSEVEMVSFGGKEYFKATSVSSGDFYGYTISIKMTTLYRFDDGFGYMFQTNIEESNAHYKDFVSLVSSMEFPPASAKEATNGKAPSAQNQNSGTSISTASNPEKESSLYTLPWVVRLLIDLCITVIIHPVPIWIYRFAIRKRPVAPKTAKRIVIIDVIIVFIIWLVLAVIMGGTKISILAFVVWSRICYSSLSKGYSLKNDYHINLSSCLIQDSPKNIETFEFEGRKYDRNKYIALESDALLKLKEKDLSDGYYKLQDDDTSKKLIGIGAANLEAHKQAILKHPDFQGTMLRRELQKESQKTESERTISSENPANEEIELHTTLQRMPRIRFCRRCGAEIGAEDNNCPRCGTPVIKVEQKE